MAAWLLIPVGVAVVVAVVALVALVWVLSGRAKPGGAINPANDAAVQRAHGQSSHSQTMNHGNPGPGI
jgi:flagellar basal body-associated protein FliL